MIETGSPSVRKKAERLCRHRPKAPPPVQKLKKPSVRQIIKGSFLFVIAYDTCPSWPGPSNSGILPERRPNYGKERGQPGPTRVPEKRNQDQISQFEVGPPHTIGAVPG